MIRNVKVITAASFLAMLFMGVGSALVGAAARDIGLTAAQIGVLIAVQNLGFAVSVTASGALADTRPKTTILFAGSLILATAFLAFYVSPLFWINLGIMLLSGIGMGTYEGAADAMLVDLHEARAGALHQRQSLLCHHRRADDRAVPDLSPDELARGGRAVGDHHPGAGGRVSAGVAAAQAAGAVQLAGEGDASWPTSRSWRCCLPLRSWLWGLRLGTIGILSTFLAEARGFEPTAAKLGLVVLLAGMAAGRLIIGFLVKPKHVLR